MLIITPEIISRNRLFTSYWLLTLSACSSQQSLTKPTPNPTLSILNQWAQSSQLQLRKEIPALPLPVLWNHWLRTQQQPKKKNSWRLAVFKKDTKVRPKTSFCWYKNPQCAHSRSIEGGCGPNSSRRAWWSYRGARGGQGPAAFIRSYQKAWDSLFSLEKRLRRILLRFARFWRQ